MIEFSKPEVKEAIGKIIFTWPELTLKIQADRFIESGNAELRFFHSNGDGDKLLHATRANLLSTTMASQLCRRLKDHNEDIPWQDVLTFITQRTLEFQRRGEPDEVLDPHPGIEHPGYYCEPVVLKGSPNVIYGEKGMMKTTLSLAILGLIGVGVYDPSESPSGLTAPEAAKVGILDWESNKNTTAYNLSRLVEGGTVPYFTPAYLRCSLPLADDIDRIADFIDKYNLEVVLIDSIGQAAGSDKFDSAGKVSALRFFECLRKLNVTSLLIGQTAKNEEGKRTIYGSVYYQYYARNIFELKGKADELDNKVMHTALFHTDSNYSKKYEPMGFRTTFNDSSIRIDREPVSLSQFLKGASQANEILEFLKNGAKTVKAITAQLKTNDKQCRTILSRLKGRGLVVDLGSGLWGLSVGEER